MSSLTGELVELIRSKPVEDADLVSAARFVLDTVACVAGARKSDAGGILAAWSGEVGSDTGREAFLASAAAHVLEIDDLHRDSVTHPGCVVVPLAWILGDSRGATGRALLTAVLHGYEAMTRIGMAVGSEHYKVWHNTATCGPFGAAMVAATLLGLSARESVWALGNAGTQASGLWQFLPDKAMSKLLHAARAADAGFVAATLAACGFTGPENILEGPQGFFRGLCPNPNPAAVLAKPHQPWQLRRTSMKPWPCCRHTHPAIDAALELHDTVGARAPERVTVRTYQAALDVCNRPAPDTAYAAKFSLQHCVAAALTAGRIGFDSFDTSHRERLAPMAGRTVLVADAEIGARYPLRWGAAIELEFSDGTRLSAQRTDCKGDPELPLSDAELIDKACLVMAEGGIDGEAASQLIERIRELPRAARTGRFPFQRTEVS